MTLWLAAHRAPAAVVLALLVGPLVWLSGDAAVPILAFLRGQAATPLALLAPLLVAVAVGWTLSLGDPVAEATSLRSTHWMDTAWAATTIAVGVVACLAAAMAGATHAMASARNVIALCGLTLTGRWLLGRDAAAALPAGVALLSALLGTSAAGQVYAWAWVADPTATLRTWLLSAVALTIGLGLTIARPRSAKVPE